MPQEAQTNGTVEIFKRKVTFWNVVVAMISGDTSYFTVWVVKFRANLSPKEAKLAKEWKLGGLYILDFEGPLLETRYRFRHFVGGMERDCLKFEDAERLRYDVERSAFPLIAELLRDPEKSVGREGSSSA